MPFDPVTFGALSAVGLHSEEKFRIFPSPLSVITTRYSAEVPYTPHQPPENDIGSTISGFELDIIDEVGEDLASTLSTTQHTPASSQASPLSDLEDEAALTSEVSHLLEAQATRIEQLLEENELQAEELRRLVKKEKKKQGKSKEKMAKYQTDVMRELLRAVTMVMTPLPEGSPARFVLMAVEAFFLRERVIVSRRQ
ncbi:uncharacterized protein M437DRAFT_84777 [Aureobasidium melanogenum CBS 110374]|uniref:Uncharacterized protein n=1 Tax=Aureobasidium melanogenum (strain CBS 110374) TaxID=1043003 RepID=A0A074VPJ2_AURM1|nr:uncharacterized protein M437DRAFT_84777 [Aureobasidium melanogenum CBS 110374]KEQ62438.1 hypothetical protein M437DRAFT_84777 [Aureobasidium melanogenum CBS 110374]